MKKLLPFVAALAVITAAVVISHAPPASAAPQFLTTLVSNDAGATQTVQINQQVNYCVQAPYPLSCFKLEQWDGGSHTADCTKDFGVTQDGFNAVAGIPGQQNPYTYCFQSAGRTAIVGAQLDGGAVSMRLLFNEQNKPR